MSDHDSGPGLGKGEAALDTIKCRDCPRLDAEIAEIIYNYGDIGPRGRRVLRMLSDRLAMGAREYGDDFSRGRMLRELLEEMLDASVYASVSLLDGMDGEG